MKVRWSFYLLLYLCISCEGQNYGNRFFSDGILLSTNGSVFWEDTVSLFNQGGELYAKIWADEDGISIVNYSDTTELKNTIIKSIKESYPRYYEDYVNNNILPKISIRSFDDGYDSPLMVFDAKQSGNTYQVLVNGEWRNIKSSKPLVYKKWNDFISESYVGLTRQSPLKSAKDEESEIIKNYERYYYEVIQVAGDWLQVQCWEDCEGCPNGQVVKGWVKWRDKEKLLIDLYYIC